MLFHSLFLLFFSLPSFSTQDKQIWKYDEVHKLNYLSNGSVIKGKKINNPIKIINLQKNFFVEEYRDFKPTIIQGKQEALKIFERLRSNYKRKSDNNIAAGPLAGNNPTGASKITGVRVESGIPHTVSGCHSHGKYCSPKAGIRC